MNGRDLMLLGYESGPHFKEMIAVGNALEENDVPQIQVMEAMDEIYDDYRAAIEAAKVTIPLQDPANVVCDWFIDDALDGYERDNWLAVRETMDAVIRTPTVFYAAVMPDACPAGPVGTIPVGGVVAAKNAIHPGMHSADICCSMFLTSFDPQSGISKHLKVGEVLDAVQRRSHFGFGGRSDLSCNQVLLQRAKDNQFLRDPKILAAMNEHMGTQGDGNHFFYVGKRESTGSLTFVTHHGSRKPGALLYKAGMKVAERYRSERSPDTLKQNAWIPFDTTDGEEYWEALQIIRTWTKVNHAVIHQVVMNELGLDYNDVVDNFWNEHNFVFKDDDTFYHAKGSTPVWGSHALDADSRGRTIIPLNMGEPILIVTNHPENVHGFAPHGAGRNMSRTKYKKTLGDKTVEQAMQEQVGHIDARFYSGSPDITELPLAYKSAKDVVDQMTAYKLAQVVDRVMPLGSMMNGEQHQPWLDKKKKKDNSNGI
jgi:tRNA-splicing ligase RtcB